MLAPFIKIPNLLKELAISQDIDPDSLVNDVNEAQIYAEILKGLQDAQQPEQPEGAPQGPSSPTQPRQNRMAGAGGVPQQPPKQTLTALVVATSELEVYRLQGRSALLEMLLKLKNNFKEMNRK